MHIEKNDLVIFTLRPIDPNNSVHEEAINGILGLLQDRHPTTINSLLRQKTLESHYLWGWRTFSVPSDFSTERWGFLTWQEAMIDLIEYLLRYE